MQEEQIRAIFTLQWIESFSKPFENVSKKSTEVFYPWNFLSESSFFFEDTLQNKKKLRAISILNQFYRRPPIPSLHHYHHHINKNIEKHWITLEGIYYIVCATWRWSVSIEWVAEQLSFFRRMTKAWKYVGG